MPRSANLKGQRFGKLTAIKRTPQRASYWFCQCDCGAVIVADNRDLRKGKTTGCRDCKSVVHGGRYSPEYTTWLAMKKRCYYPKHEKWRIYGGRGITVCDRWRYSFANFLADMGHKPSPEHTIDRYPDADGNYEPGNCRWATPLEQQWNRAA
jgi:hypothetical protein